MLWEQLRKPPFLERTLPFTYGYVIPKSDYFGNMISRASQCEMGCQALLLEITEVQFVKGISTVNGKEQAICHTPQQGG